MTHPSLGVPPLDETAGFPSDAAHLVGDRARVGRRAIEVALDLDPTLRERLGDDGIARLLRDTEIIIDRLGRAIASDEPAVMGEFAESLAPVYRRRRVAMDDAITLCEGVRSAAAIALSPEAKPCADRAIDAAIAAFRRHRRLGGDARKRNKLLAFIYKGA